MYQIKSFTYSCTYGVGDSMTAEDQFNKWALENQGIEVIQIENTVGGNEDGSWNTLTVLYKVDAA